MATNAKGVIFGGMGAAGLMLLLGVVDIAIRSPFGGQTVMDVLLILGAGLVLYMGYDCLKDLK